MARNRFRSLSIEREGREGSGRHVVSRHLMTSCDQKLNIVMKVSKGGASSRGSLTCRVKWFRGYIDIDIGIDLDLNSSLGESEKRCNQTMNL